MQIHLPFSSTCHSSSAYQYLPLSPPLPSLPLCLYYSPSISHPHSLQQSPTPPDNSPLSTKRGLKEDIFQSKPSANQPPRPPSQLPLATPHTSSNTTPSPTLSGSAIRGKSTYKDINSSLTPETYVIYHSFARSY